MSDEIRSKYLTIRVNEEEKAKVKEAQAYRGFAALTSYLKHLLFKDYNKMRMDKKRLGVMVLALMLSGGAAQALVPDPERLCTAIYHAEGGSNTRHPYGIMQKYKTTTPKQACINTVNSAIKRYKTDSKGMDFISFLGSTYAPLNAKNDPSGLNRNWITNVRRLYGVQSVYSERNGMVGNG